ncbi:MAG: hypothetical protein FJ304_24420 [Planctomycetes bacterium]|nr:hypothetical protein [Planctomycetota bacterium]
MAYHIRAIVAVLTCSLAVGSSVADEPADKAKELEKRVAQLEQRVAELTKQVDRLEKALAEREGRVGTTVRVGQDFPSAIAVLMTAGAKPRKEGELFVTELIISGARNPEWYITSQWLLPDNTAVIRCSSR